MGLIKNRLWISEPAIALGAWIGRGLIGFDFLNAGFTAPAGAPFRESAWVTLALAVMATGLRVRRSFLRTA